MGLLYTRVYMIVYSMCMYYWSIAQPIHYLYWIMLLQIYLLKIKLLSWLLSDLNLSLSLTQNYHMISEDTCLGLFAAFAALGHYICSQFMETSSVNILLNFEFHRRNKIRCFEQHERKKKFPLYCKQQALEL